MGKTLVLTEIQPQECQCHFWVSLLDMSCSVTLPTSYISLNLCQPIHPNTLQDIYIGPEVKASLAGIPPRQETFLMTLDLKMVIPMISKPYPAQPTEGKPH
ncbi:hypothetical protein Tco_1566723 [Tanacetum coccineum]